MPKTSNYRLAKIHRNYTVEEAARLFGVHRNTVRMWIKRGLPVVAGHPVLILGRELRAFLHGRREAARRSCRSGEMYWGVVSLERRLWIWSSITGPRSPVGGSLRSARGAAP